MSLVVRDNGTVVARASSGYDCRGYGGTAFVRLSGRVRGQTVTARGVSRLRGGAMRVSLTGTVGPDAVTGRVRVRVRGCYRVTRSFVLRGPGVPAGAPAAATPGTVLYGLTSQSAGRIRLPVSIRVARNGRIFAYWQAKLRCTRGTIVSMLNVTPPTTVKPDGTFSRTERYRIRFSDGPDEDYRVTFKGRFLADGAVGTLRARMVWRERGTRYFPCVSGTQNWVARP